MNNVNVNKLDNSGKKSMKTRIATAIILILFSGAALVLGGWAWFAYITVAMLFAIYEFIHVTGKKYRWYVYVICYICTIMFYGWTLLQGNLYAYSVNETFSLQKYCNSLSISLFGAALSLGAVFFISILHENFDLKDATYLFTMCFLIGIGFQSLLFIRYYPEHSAYFDYGFSVADLNDHWFTYFKSALLLAFVILCTCLNDAMAYFVGVFFGKRKINPRISPKKTIEGFYGGWILSSLITFAIFLFFSALGFDLLPGSLDLTHWYWVLLLCIVIPLLGNLGDFSFSLIKRSFDTKDYGYIIVGHGGVLDRADSIIFTCIGVAIILTCIETGWSIF